MKFAIFLLEITIACGFMYWIYRAITAGNNKVNTLKDQYNKSNQASTEFKEFKNSIKTKDEQVD